MKKLTLMLVIMFVISTLCIPASAVEPNPNAVVVSDPVTQEALTDLAILAFPEYEAKIRGEHLAGLARNAATLANNTEPTLIISETRQLTDETFVTYQEYDNGIVLTSGGTIVGKTVTDIYSEVTHTTTTINMWLQLTGSQQIMYVHNVQYTFLENGYGAVNNSGYIPSISTARLEKLYHLIPLGSANGPAILQYEAIFDSQIILPSGDSMPISYAGYLTLRVYPDSVELTGSYLPT